MNTDMLRRKLYKIIGTNAQYEQGDQIISLVEEEIRKARVEEVDRLWNKLPEASGGNYHGHEIDSLLQERLKQLKEQS